MTKTPDSVTNGIRCFLYIDFLWGMKSFVQLMMVLLLSSCGLEQTGSGTHTGSDGVWRGPSYGKHMSGTWYAAALDYPEGYDWRTGAEDEGVFIVMFADGVPVLKVPAGRKHEVPGDPQRIRIRSGHLYTDYTDGTVTVIKRDGEEILRYDGAEEAVALEYVEGRLHMLCVPETGSGFVYRVDGEAAVARDEGKLYGGLEVWDGRVGFCFANQSRSYEVRDGKVALVTPEEDTAEITDMQICEGRLCMLTKTDGRNSPAMHVGDIRIFNDHFESLDIVSSRFLDTDSLCVRLRCRDGSSDLLCDRLWFSDGLSRMPRRVTRLLSVVVDATGYHAVANPSEIHEGCIFSNRDYHDLPEGYHVYGDGCAVVRDSILYVGLTSGKGGSPVIWKDGALDTLDVNGPLICLR